MVEQKETEYKLIYWPGRNFAGRGEYVRLMLECAGQELGVGYRDVGREEGASELLGQMYE